MFSLIKIKLVLFDFNDTLFIDSNYTNRLNSLASLGTFNLWGGFNKLSNINNSIVLKDFMIACKGLDIRLGLLSDTNSIMEHNLRLGWVESNYGFRLESYNMFPDYKLECLERIIQGSNFSAKQILIVDDSIENLKLFSKLGVSVASPLEIANYILS